MTPLASQQRRRLLDLNIYCEYRNSRSLLFHWRYAISCGSDGSDAHQDGMKGTARAAVCYLQHQ
jgi:hypothetical protein